jgi:hypothetical protein
LADYPATPTPLPPAPEAPIDIPQVSGGMGIWQSSDDFIQRWNQFDPYTTVFQAILLLVVVIFALRFIMRKIRSLSNEQDEAQPAITNIVRMPRPMFRAGRRRY